MAKLKDLKGNLEATVTNLQAAEASFRQATAEEERARNAASASQTLKAKAAKESAHQQILERASELEAALEAFRKQLEADYRNELFAATVESRALSEKRQELVAVLADVDQQIGVVTEREQSDVDKAVSNELFASQYANYAATYAYNCVRLTQSAAVAA